MLPSVFSVTPEARGSVFLPSSVEERLQEFRPILSISLDADSQEYFADLGDASGLL
jgi:hypothetical protein